MRLLLFLICFVVMLAVVGYMLRLVFGGTKPAAATANEHE
jgi:hypothetical protein